jgi:ubiquinone/menaquinone biosynthesis C-methylase UbiE
MKHFDFGQVVKNYARTRNDIPNSLFDSLMIRHIIFDGKKVADLGSGTGAFTRKLKLRKANVIGVEPSKILLSEAKTTGENEYLPIPYIHGKAEQTGLDSDEFDVVTVMRTWHLYNRKEALTEIKRILKQNGKLLIIDSGVLNTSTLVEDTLMLLKKKIKNGMSQSIPKSESIQQINGFPVQWFEEWNAHGFELTDFYKLDYRVPYSNREWIERVSTIPFVESLEQKELQAFIEELDELIDQRVGRGKTLMVPHSCNVAILRT